MENSFKGRIFGTPVLSLVAALGLLQGAALVFWGSKGAVVTLGMWCIYALFRWPHLVLIAALVIIFDGLGFINGDFFFRVPGVFRLKDLIFCCLFLPLLFNIKWQKRAAAIYHEYRTLLFPILVILVLTTMQMVRTSFQYDLPLTTCIMAGREYWYYAFLPLAAIYIDDVRKRKVTFNLFLLVISVLAGIIIIQTVTLWLGGKLFLTSNIQVQLREWGILKLSRIYPPGEPALVLGFALAFWGMVLKKESRERIAYAVMTLICGLSVLLVNSRMRWAHALLVVLIPVVLLWIHIPRAGRRSLVLACIPFLLFVWAFGVSDWGGHYVSGIMARAFSGWDDFRGGKGTWGSRLEESQFRFKLIREHSLFGLGFVHPDYAWAFGGRGVVEIDEDGGHFQKEGVSTQDSGIVSLLIHFGVLGVLWAIWYSISVFRLCSRMLKSPGNSRIHWVFIPLAGYMAGGLVTFVTLGLFTMASEIVGYSFALGMSIAGEWIQNSPRH